jgi:hypothetical protein
MRLACVLAIALGLSFPAAGQTPVAPAPAEKATAEPAPVAEQNAPESGAKKKTDVDSASGTTKRLKRSAPAPDGAPRKIVVREGGASEPAAQIAPDITPAEATRERQGTEQLLGAAGGELKQLAGRALDARQQETVGQIRNYMDGARSALHEGDVRRAGTLAQKAHLLAEDLVKH